MTGYETNPRHQEALANAYTVFLWMNMSGPHRDVTGMTIVVFEGNHPQMASSLPISCQGTNFSFSQIMIVDTTLWRIESIYIYKLYKR